MRMRYALVLVTLGLAAADAHAGSLRKARDAVADAIDDGRDEERECRRALRGLEAVRDQLDEGGRRNVKMALRRLRDIADDAEDDCPKPLRRTLRRAVDLLAEFGDRDRDDDDDDRPRRRERDRDDDDDRPRRRVDCWNNQDPGCFNTKGGNPPMGRAAFEGLRRSVASMSPNVFQMLDALRAGMQNAYMTSMQLTVIVRLFKPNVFQMLDAVKVCAPRLVDPQNGQGVAAEFQPNVFQARDAAAIIGAQRGDQ